MTGSNVGVSPRRGAVVVDVLHWHVWPIVIYIASWEKCCVFGCGGAALVCLVILYSWVCRWWISQIDVGRHHSRRVSECDAIAFPLAAGVQQGVFRSACMTWLVREGRVVTL